MNTQNVTDFHSIFYVWIYAILTTTIEPWHESIVLFVLRKLFLQMHMRSHPVGLHEDVRFSVGPFVYFHALCVRTAKAVVRLRGCAGSPEPSLVAYVINLYDNLMSSVYINFNSTNDDNNHKLVHKWMNVIRKLR